MNDGAAVADFLVKFQFRPHPSKIHGFPAEIGPRSGKPAGCCNGRRLRAVA
jgi:hypothetical protein